MELDETWSYIEIQDNTFHPLLPPPTTPTIEGHGLQKTVGSNSLGRRPLWHPLWLHATIHAPRARGEPLLPATITRRHQQAHPRNRAHRHRQAHPCSRALVSMGGWPGNCAEEDIRPEMGNEEFQPELEWRIMQHHQHYQRARGHWRP